MRFFPIAPNLYIEENPSFGDYNHEIVHGLLKSIDITFSNCLNRPPFSSGNCLISYRPDHPRCNQIGNIHEILLHTYQNYWCKWIYQFAHEYCHHLINGPMVGGVSGLIWFEETICELSSMFNLQVLYTQWSQTSELIRHRYAPSLQDYLDDLLSQQPQLLLTTLHPGFLQHWEQTLSEPRYHREYYNALAARMFPLFVENPHLWKIILHFGDMRKWHSLHELFEHLHLNADADYADSLQKLHDVLFS